MLELRRSLELLRLLALGCFLALAGDAARRAAGAAARLPGEAVRLLAVLLVLLEERMLEERCGVDPRLGFSGWSGLPFRSTAAPPGLSGEEDRLARSI